MVQNRLRVVAAVVTGLLASNTHAQPIIAQSTFDSDAQGWLVRTVTGNPCGVGVATTTAGNRTHVTTGGIAGGFIRHTNQNQRQMFQAPADFRGNLSAATGGSISFTRRLNTNDTTPAERYEDVYVVGPAGTLVGNLAHPPVGAWATQRLDFLYGFWRTSCTGPFATEQQIDAVLANVSNIYIMAEYSDIAHSTDLDNVELSGPAASPPACSATWDEVSDSIPTARWRHAMAVDTARNVLVLFGGLTGETDTWEFDLTSQVWSRVPTAVSPSRRDGHAMAYDVSRGKIVMTGGTYFTFTDEVWEYDTQANTWTLSTPLPQPRAGHAMVYDTTRNTMVLYGGLASGVAGAQDVLERSSTNSAWTARTPTTPNPDVQIGHSMAYDAARQRTVLVGQGTTVVDVWEWNAQASTWTSSTVSSTPAWRFNPLVVYNPVDQVTTLVGGGGSQSTWDYDGTMWIARANMPTSAGRDEHTGAYDPVNNRILVHGGFVGNQNVTAAMVAYQGGDTNTWSTVTPNTAPSLRWQSPTSYDEAGQRVILYGGQVLQRAGQTTRFSGATYEFRNDAWAAIVTNNPDGAPPANQGAPLVYIPSRGSMIMYGGRTDSAASTLRSVWELDLGTETWRNRTPSGTTPPGQRYRHAAAFDRLRGRMVVYGGESEMGERLDSTWIYDPATQSWTQAALTGPTPGIRSEAAMAFDEARGVIVLFGGLSTATGNTFDERTWEWNGVEWRDATPAVPAPRGRRLASLVYDPNLRAVVLSGGLISVGDNAPVFGDMWAFDGLSWRSLSQPSTEHPIGTWFANVAFDRGRGAMFHFGGIPLRNGDLVTGQTFYATFQCPGTCDPIDFNGDGVFPDSGDIADYLAVFGGGACSNDPNCGDLDFNNDGVSPDSADIQSLLSVFSGGAC